MKVIGLTGGIGSGKTTVAEIFKVLGIPIYNSDQRAKYLMNHSPELIAKIKANFGEESYKNNTLNREYIASVIFHDKTKLQTINNIVHPAVAKDFEQWANKQTTAPYIIKESAILIESGGHQHVDKIIVVTAPTNLRIKRVQQRDNATKKEVEARLNNQMSDKERKTYADYLINNDSKQSLIKQVLIIHKSILEED